LYGVSVKFSFSILKAVIIAPVVKALNPSVTAYYINRGEKTVAGEIRT